MNRISRRIKGVLTIWLAVLFLASQSSITSARATKAVDTDQSGAISDESRLEPIRVPGRLLVKYRAGVSSARQNSLMMAAGARTSHEISSLRVQVVELADGADAGVYTRALKLQPEVEFVEPDYLCYPVSTMEPDDLLYPSQWHLPVIGCPTAWGMTTGSNQVIIALCDSGVESTHPDLASKIVPGWNVVDNNGDTSAVSAHGTWTAGTAAATGDNSIGVASPAMNCRLMPVRVSSRSDGAALISDMAAGVAWAADHGARVASVSYMAGGSGTMATAGDYIQRVGGVLVVAAGNTGSYYYSPDSPSIIVVGATNQSDGVASFSTTGSYVDLSAPGSSILTTGPGGTYQSVSGTSFSTPLVSGAIGLMLSINPSLTPIQIDTVLKVSADDFGPAGWDPGFGWGRLNVGRALEIAAAMAAGGPDTVAPAIGFLQPQIGGDANGLIGISARELVSLNALDDRGVAEASLFIDGISVGVNASAPYRFYCDTSLYADGSHHTLTAMARDQAGNTKIISTTVTAKVGFDATPPIVGFAQPQENGQIVISSNASVQLSASDNQAIGSVSLIADGSLIATVTALPYTFTWNTSSFAIGSLHTLNAFATDLANNWTSVSTTVSAALPTDATPPSVSFQKLQVGGTVSGSQSQQITVNASDNVAVASVSLFADGTLVGAGLTAPYAFSWNTSALASGSSHALRAVAVDQAGNSSSVSITVTVRELDTTAPQVWFVEPGNGDRVKGDVRVSVGASDNFAVTRVELYIDNQLFTTWTQAAYTVNWRSNNASRGNHTLKCVAFDAAGNKATTAITVNIR